MRTADRCTPGLAAILAVLFVAPGFAREPHKFHFATLEGEVRAVGEQQGDGEIRLLSVELMTDRRPSEKVTVLLGPTEACREIGLVVEEGDRVRVRVFVSEEGEAVKAQKILNLSRSVMVRLRTMHDIPLWNSAGAWQGGPGRAYRGGHHGVGRRGASGPGRGPGGR